MKRVKQFLFRSVLLLLAAFSIVFSQEQPNNLHKFFIGAYMNSSFNTDTAKYSLWRAEHLGINAPIIYSQRTSVDDDPQIHYTGNTSDVLTNLNLLQPYKNVIASNTFSSFKVLDGIIENTAIRNFDWIYFYSGAYYSKWDATSTYPWSDSLVLRHDYGSLKTVNEKTYWSSGAQTNNVSGYLVKGPNYLQETRYRSSVYPGENNDTVIYKAYFNLLLAQPPVPGKENEEVCEISVYCKYELQGVIDTEKIASRILTAEQIGQPDFKTLTYDFSDYCQNAWLMEKGDATGGCTGKKLVDVEFRIDWFGNQELMIDYIDVYDQDIWKNRLSNEDGQNLARENIVAYLNRFKDENLAFYNNNLRYFHGVDEPHTVDSYTAHKFVVDVLDSLNNVWTEGAPQLWIHLYPGYYGYIDLEPIFPRFINTVNPKPFHFYFAPYRYGDPIEISLEGLRNILDLAAEANQYRDFYFTLDVWDQVSIGWRKPTPEELNAGVMLALSFGAKGIIYEPMYSYNTTNDEPVGGLWKPYPNQNELLDIGIKVRDDINPRLNGVLGTTLLNLDYNGNDLMLRDVDVTNVEDLHYSNISYLTLTNNPSNNPQNPTLNFFACDLDTTVEHSLNNYFLLSNLVTSGSRVAEMNLIESTTAYVNTRFRNIETINNFDTTFTGSITLTYTFPAGEGYLFQVAPVVLYGGRLIYNETVSTATLWDDMIIENGATLTVSGIYTANGNIIVKDGGSLKTLNGGTINFMGGHKLIIDGLATVKGTAAKKLF